MIDDIIYDNTGFILEIIPSIAGVISGYSLDGNSFDFEAGSETNSPFSG